MIITIVDHFSPSSDEQVSASERKLGFFEAISPWCPFVMFSVLYIMWVEFSPSDILEKEPRILIFSMGVLFSNIAVSQGEVRGLGEHCYDLVSG